ncbi:MAG: bifunctional riboflavin kinase/FAD synthetase [Pirellulales bacterium]
MKLLRQVADLPDELRGGAVAIGNFDGVHRGHARIVARLLEKARAVGGPGVVFTFDPHPVRVLRPAEAPPPLTWTDRKAELLAALGVDAVIAYPTDEELLALAPGDFFQRIVRDVLDAKAMVEGPNFYFGRGRAGTIDVLRGLTRESGIQLDVVEPVIEGDQIVSSSRVRKLLAEGHVEEARRMLTEPYRIRGMVVHGAGRGAKIGFATANINAIDTLLPAVGVYAGRGFVNNNVWPAAINIGPNPTFGGAELKVEAHLLGWDDSPLYGQPLEIDFLTRLRGVQRFADVDALKKQLASDIEFAHREFDNFTTTK